MSEKLPGDTARADREKDKANHMGKADFVGGVGIALFGILLIFVIIPLGTAKGEYYGLAPTFFPTLLAIGVTISAAFLAVQGWFKMRSGTDKRPMPITGWNFLMFLIAAALVTLGVAAIDYFGMMYAAPVLIAAFMLFLGEKNIIRIALTSTIPVAVVYLMATHVLRAPLP